MNIKCIYIDDDKLLYENLTLLRGCKEVGIDIETTGEKKEYALDPWKGEIRLIQISSPDSLVLVVDWFKLTQSGKQLIKEFLEDVERVKILHNAKFDIKFLMLSGINVNNAMDTMLMAGVLEAGLKEPLKLDSLVFRYLGLELSKKEQKSDWGRETLSEEQIKYSAIDAGVLIPLAHTLMQEVNSNKLTETLSLEMRSLPAIVDMELNGIKVDRKKLNALQQNLKTKQYELLEMLQQEFGEKFNPKSPKQVSRALKGIKVEVENTSKSTLSKVVNQHKAVQTLLDYKEATKQLEFAKKIPKAINSITGRVHSNYFQLGTDTGRLSCTKFNLQQVPHIKEFRECFIPDEGMTFIIADYSQMQIRIAAEYSKDPVLKESYQNGYDLHRITASVLTGKDVNEVSLEERSLAKALNFGMMFGMGASSLVKYAWSNYNVQLTVEQASNFIDKFYEKYTGLKLW